MTRLPILMYHQVSPDVPPRFAKYVVRPVQFAAQMSWLARAGYRAVDLDAVLAARRGGPPLPRRAVAITFDDGFADSVQHALPVLRQHGFTATFYLVAGLMGGTSEWLRAERGVELPIISWETARTIADAGVCSGAHTMTHPHLADLPSEAQRAELARSREILEQRLGRAVEHLAYPHGSYDASTLEIVAELGYASACTVRAGLSDASDNRLALRRVPIDGQESAIDFVWRVRTARSFRQWLRELVLRRQVKQAA